MTDHQYNSVPQMDDFVYGGTSFLHLDTPNVLEPPGGSARGIKQKQKNDTANSRSQPIRAFLRIQPSHREEEEEEIDSFEVLEEQSIVKADGFDYHFDRIFDERKCGDSIVAEIANVVSVPVVESILGGHNATVFTYGGTRSGKSKSLYGSVIPAVLSTLFAKLDVKRYVYRIQCSCFDLFDERMNDLLTLPEERKELHLRHHPSLGLLVDGLSTYEVKSIGDVQGLLDFAFKMRTLTGGRSSGHTVLTFFIERYARAHLPYSAQELMQMQPPHRVNAMDESCTPTKHQGCYEQMPPGSSSPLANSSAVPRVVAGSSSCSGGQQVQSKSSSSGFLCSPRLRGKKSYDHVAPRIDCGRLSPRSLSGGAQNNINLAPTTPTSSASLQHTTPTSSLSPQKQPAGVGDGKQLHGSKQVVTSKHLYQNQATPPPGSSGHKKVTFTTTCGGGSISYTPQPLNASQQRQQQEEAQRSTIFLTTALHFVDLAGHDISDIDNPNNGNLAHLADCIRHLSDLSMQQRAKKLELLAQQQSSTTSSQNTINGSTNANMNIKAPVNKTDHHLDQPYEGIKDYVPTFGIPPPLPGKKSSRYDRVQSSVMMSTMSRSSIGGTNINNNANGSSGATLVSPRGTSVSSGGGGLLSTPRGTSTSASALADSTEKMSGITTNLLPALRDKKLTTLLAHSLAGNCRTSVLATVSVGKCPLGRGVSDEFGTCLFGGEDVRNAAALGSRSSLSVTASSRSTLHQTLQFAHHCRQIDTAASPGFVQGYTRDGLIARMFGEVRKLQLQLQKGGSGAKVTGDHERVYTRLIRDILSFDESFRRPPAAQHQQLVNHSSPNNVNNANIREDGLGRGQNGLPQITVAEATTGDENLRAIFEERASVLVTRLNTCCQVIPNEVAPMNLITTTATGMEDEDVASDVGGTDDDEEPPNTSPQPNNYSNSTTGNNNTSYDHVSAGAATSTGRISDYFRSARTISPYLLSVHADLMLHNILKFSLKKRKTLIGTAAVGAGGTPAGIGMLDICVPTPVDLLQEAVRLAGGVAGQGPLQLEDLVLELTMYFDDLTGKVTYFTARSLNGMRKDANCISNTGYATTTTSSGCAGTAAGAGSSSTTSRTSKVDRLEETWKICVNGYPVPNGALVKVVRGDQISVADFRFELRIPENAKAPAEIRHVFYPPPPSHMLSSSSLPGGEHVDAFNQDPQDAFEELGAPRSLEEAQEMPGPGDVYGNAGDVFGFPEPGAALGAIEELPEDESRSVVPPPIITTPPNANADAAEAEVERLKWELERAQRRCEELQQQQYLGGRPKEQQLHPEVVSDEEHQPENHNHLEVQEPQQDLEKERQEEDIEVQEMNICDSSSIPLANDNYMGNYTSANDDNFIYEQTGINYNFVRGSEDPDDEELSPSVKYIAPGVVGASCSKSRSLSQEQSASHAQQEDEAHQHQDVEHEGAGFISLEDEERKNQDSSLQGEDEGTTSSPAVQKVEPTSNNLRISVIQASLSDLHDEIVEARRSGPTGGPQAVGACTTTASADHHLFTPREKEMNDQNQNPTTTTITGETSRAVQRKVLETEESLMLQGGANNRAPLLSATAAAQQCQQRGQQETILTMTSPRFRGQQHTSPRGPALPSANTNNMIDADVDDPSVTAFLPKEESISNMMACSPDGAALVGGPPTGAHKIHDIQPGGGPKKQALKDMKILNNRGGNETQKSSVAAADGEGQYFGCNLLDHGANINPGEVDMESVRLESASVGPYPGAPPAVFATPNSETHLFEYNTPALDEEAANIIEQYKADDGGDHVGGLRRASQVAPPVTMSQTLRSELTTPDVVAEDHKNMQMNLAQPVSPHVAGQKNVVQKCLQQQQSLQSVPSHGRVSTASTAAILNNNNNNSTAYNNYNCSQSSLVPLAGQQSFVIRRDPTLGSDFGGGRQSNRNSQCTSSAAVQQVEGVAVQEQLQRFVQGGPTSAAPTTDATYNRGNKMAAHHDQDLLHQHDAAAVAGETTAESSGGGSKDHPPGGDHGSKQSFCSAQEEEQLASRSSSHFDDQQAEHPQDHFVYLTNSSKDSAQQQPRHLQDEEGVLTSKDTLMPSSSNGARQPVPAANITTSNQSNSKQLSKASDGSDVVGGEFISLAGKRRGLFSTRPAFLDTQNNIDTCSQQDSHQRGESHETNYDSQISSTKPRDAAPVPEELHHLPVGAPGGSPSDLQNKFPVRASLQTTKIKAPQIASLGFASPTPPAYLPGPTPNASMMLKYNNQRAVVNSATCPNGVAAFPIMNPNVERSRSVGPTFSNIKMISAISTGSSTSCNKKGDLVSVATAGGVAAGGPAPVGASAGCAPLQQIATTGIHLGGKRQTRTAGGDQLSASANATVFAPTPRTRSTGSATPLCASSATPIMGGPNIQLEQTQTGGSGPGTITPLWSTNSRTRATMPMAQLVQIHAHNPNPSPTCTSVSTPVAPLPVPGTTVTPAWSSARPTPPPPGGAVQVIGKPTTATNTGNARNNGGGGSLTPTFNFYRPPPTSSSNLTNNVSVNKRTTRNQQHAKNANAVWSANYGTTSKERNDGEKNQTLAAQDHEYNTNGKSFHNNSAAAEESTSVADEGLVSTSPGRFLCPPEDGLKNIPPEVQVDGGSTTIIPKSSYSTISSEKTQRQQKLCENIRMDRVMEESSCPLPHAVEVLEEDAGVEGLLHSEGIKVDRDPMEDSEHQQLRGLEGSADHVGFAAPSTSNTSGVGPRYLPAERFADLGACADNFPEGDGSCGAPGQRGSAPSEAHTGGCEPGTTGTLQTGTSMGAQPPAPHQRQIMNNMQDKNITGGDFAEKLQLGHKKIQASLEQAKQRAMSGFRSRISEIVLSPRPVSAGPNSHSARNQTTQVLAKNETVLVAARNRRAAAGSSSRGSSPALPEQAEVQVEGNDCNKGPADGATTSSTIATSKNINQVQNNNLSLSLNNNCILKTPRGVSNFTMGFLSPRNNMVPHPVMNQVRTIDASQENPLPHQAGAPRDATPIHYNMSHMNTRAFTRVNAEVSSKSTHPQSSKSTSGPSSKVTSKITTGDDHLSKSGAAGHPGRNLGLHLDSQNISQSRHSFGLARPTGLRTPAISMERPVRTPLQCWNQPPGVSKPFGGVPHQQQGVVDGAKVDLLLGSRRSDLSSSHSGREPQQQVVVEGASPYACNFAQQQRQVEPGGGGRPSLGGAPMVGRISPFPNGKHLTILNSALGGAPLDAPAIKRLQSSDVTSKANAFTLTLGKVSSAGSSNKRHQSAAPSSSGAGQAGSLAAKHIHVTKNHANQLQTASTSSSSHGPSKMNMSTRKKTISTPESSRTVASTPRSTNNNKSNQIKVSPTKSSSKLGPASKHTSAAHTSSPSKTASNNKAGGPNIKHQLTPKKDLICNTAGGSVLGGATPSSPTFEAQNVHLVPSTPTGIGHLNSSDASTNNSGVKLAALPAFCPPTLGTTRTGSTSTSFRGSLGGGLMIPLCAGAAQQQQQQLVAEQPYNFSFAAFPGKQGHGVSTSAHTTSSGSVKVPPAAAGPHAGTNKSGKKTSSWK